VVSAWRRLAAAFGALAAACGPAAAPGFDGPWSALHDVAADLYLVSSVNGQPLAKDGNGYISRVRPDGAMERHWLRGGANGVTLHAPKGLALHGGVLHVADIDVVRRFDAANGAPRGETVIPGASCLDDVAVGPDGSVYVSDRGVGAEAGSATGTDAIWRIAPDGVLTALAKGEALGQPTALVARPQGLYVVSHRHGVFAQVDYRGVRTELATVPTAQLVGLVRVEDAAGAGWIAASQIGECLYRFDAKGGVQRLPGAPIKAGDIGLDEGRGRLLVPVFAADRLQIVPLAAATGADGRR
jgi:hypothetical protein